MSGAQEFDVSNSPHPTDCSWPCVSAYRWDLQKTRCLKCARSRSWLVCNRTRDLLWPRQSIWIRAIWEQARLCSLKLWNRTGRVHCKTPDAQSSVTKAGRASTPEHLWLIDKSSMTENANSIRIKPKTQSEAVLQICLSNSRYPMSCVLLVLLLSNGSC